MKASKRSKCYTMRVAAVLLCLVLFSLCFVNPGLYARFTGRALGADQARVARFAVTPEGRYVTSETVFGNLGPGEDGLYSFKVNFDCGVRTRCTVSLTTTENLPLTFGLMVGGEEVEPEVDDTPTWVVMLEPETEEVTFTLTATWPSDRNSSDLLDEVDALFLQIVCEQIA